MMIGSALSTEITRRAKPNGFFVPFVLSGADATMRPDAHVSTSRWVASGKRIVSGPTSTSAVSARVAACTHGSGVSRL